MSRPAFARLGLSLLLLAGSALSAAQPVPFVEPRNVVQLSASGTVEAAQDWLTLSLSITREGADPGAVQAQLRQVLDGALAELKKTAQPGALEVRTGSFSLQPHFGREGRISTWVGSSELVLEGSDFARISAAAARAPGLSIGGLAFSLSRATRARLETQAQGLALEAFKRKAAEIAQGFGFADYGLREVSVAAAEPLGGPQPRIMAMAARATMDAAPVPLESGKSQVVVTVSGTVQLK